MSAPAAMPEMRVPSGSGGDRLKERLQSCCLSDHGQEQRGASEDRHRRSLKIDAEGAMKKADEEIVSGLKILDPDLKRLHKVCDAHDIIARNSGEPTVTGATDGKTA